MSKDRQATSLERLTFFSDAVFAIAMTLLVIELRVPHLPALTDRALLGGLTGLLPGYIGFVVSFVVVARFWMGHHRVFGMLVAVPPRLLQANLLFLLTIAFMPFPTAVLSDYVELRTAGIFYSLWLLATGLANAAVIAVALRDPAFLHPDVTPAEIGLARRSRWLPVFVGAVAALASLAGSGFGIAILVAATPVIGAILTRTAPAAAASTATGERAE